MKQEKELMDCELREDFDEALQIINNLIDGLKFMPVSWDDALTLDVSDRVKAFMRKHDPQRWGSGKEKPKVTDRL